MELFGFSIKRKDEDEEATKLSSFTPPINDDGAVVVSAGGAYGTYIDLENSSKDEAELVTKYRSMAMQAEVQKAIEDIINEMVITSAKDKVVECVTDDVDQPESIKKKIRDEFDNILKLLEFNDKGYDIVQKWYIDGRIYYHAIIDEDNPKSGIKELRYVDPRKIRKIKEIVKKRDGEAVVQQVKNEYYIYNDRGFTGKGNIGVSDNGIQGLKIAKDSIVHGTSGIVNETNTLVLSHLHKAIKPVNQLRMLEDAAVIYRISRAPERRIFYIDVGDLPKMKAEQYLRDMMAKHKNKLVYDANTGEVRDDRKFMTMLEDFWLPRRDGTRGTEISTLPGGQNLGEMDDVVYFQKKMYQSLNVPLSRMETEAGFSLGRSSEISRDEVKFSKFVDRLRNRFSIVFDKILERQLILKGIILPNEWKEIQANLRYDFMEDNHFQELKQAEIIQNRATVLQMVDDYTGKYFSISWIRKNVLMQTEDEIEEMDKEMEAEKELEDEFDAENEDNMGDPNQQPPNAAPQPAQQPVNLVVNATPQKPEEKPKKEEIEINPLELELLENMNKLIGNMANDDLEME